MFSLLAFAGFVAIASTAPAPSPSTTLRPQSTTGVNLSGNNASAPIAATSTTPSSSTTVTQACAVVSASWAAAAASSSAVIVDAQIAYDCLNSVPVDFTGDIEFVDQLKEYIQFQSTLTYSLHLIPSIKQNTEMI